MNITVVKEAESVKLSVKDKRKRVKKFCRGF